MPLPAALLKRLAKRGLVEKKSGDGQNQSGQAPTEEIIAEDYDDVEEQPYNCDYDYQPKKKTENFWSEKLKRRITDGSINGYKGCPNKYNIFHRCSLFCVNTFGDGIKEPSNEYQKRKIRLLKRYPLHKDWKEVYDNGIGVHYYWNTVDDTVSWLPPKHPKSVISKSAATIRKELDIALPEDEIDEGNSNSNTVVSGVEMPSYQDVPIMPVKNPPIKKSKARDLDKVLRLKSERRQKRDPNNDKIIDPMDPSSYSDCPRGKWSSGLEAESKKSKTDSDDKSIDT